MADATITGLTSGMYSGIDWMNTIIPGLVAIEKRQIDLWKTQKRDYKLEQNTWQDLNMRFLNLKDKSLNLLQDSTWEKVKITSSDESFITATDAGFAVAGIYDIRVRQLATASMLTSSNDLNNHIAKRSSEEVISGSTKTVNLTTTEHPWNQFDNPIDGTITISNSVGASAVFTISNYTSVQGLIDAINTNTTLNTSTRGILLRYDSEVDKFTIEVTGSATILGLGESPGTATGFFTETNIATLPFPHTYPPDSYDDVGIAPNSKFSNANFDVVLGDSGSFKVNGETISWTKGGSTLNGIMSAINTSAAGVNAFYDEALDKVILSSKVSGPYNIEVSDVVGNLAAALKIDGATLSLGQEAKFTINSTSDADEITKRSNTFTIGGVTYTLKKKNTSTGSFGSNWYANTDGKTTITVTKDIDAIKGTINDWVSQWNSAMGFLKDSMQYDETKKEASPLSGSGTALRIQQRMYTLTTNRYDASPPNLPSSMNQLAHIGITLGAYRSGNEGKLVVDDKVLSNALKDNLQDVEDLFGISKTGGAFKDYGIAYEICEYTDDLTNSTGIIANEINLYSNPNKTGLIDMIDKRIADYEEYIERYKKNLEREFYAMEIAMGQMQAQLKNLLNYWPRSK